MRIRLPAIKPRDWQLRYFWARSLGTRNILLTWPRRHGKDVSMLSGCVMEAMRRVGSYYYLFPTRAWAERAIWNNVVTINGQSGRLIDILIPPELVRSKNVKDVRIELKNGSMINFGGTDNLDFVGQGGYLYVLSEFSLHKEDVTDFIAPILTEGQGKLWLNGTLRGEENKLFSMLEKNRYRADWFVEHLRPEDTKQYYWVSDADGISINPELAGCVNPLTGAAFENIQELVDSGACSFAFALQEYMNRAIITGKGAYYQHEIGRLRDSGRYCPDLYNPAEPVYTAWDLGGVREEADHTAIGFFQKTGGFINWIDYYERQGGTIAEHLGVVGAKGYRYGGHYMPHDAKRSNIQTGTGLVEHIRVEYGIDMRVIPKTQQTGTDIEITRRSFVRWRFDSANCRKLVNRVSAYRRNEKTMKPVHDENSHAADVVRYAAMADHLKLIEPYLIQERKERIWRAHDDYMVY
jgi:hypothetical protein